MSILSNMIPSTGASTGLQIAEKDLVGREDLIQPMMIRDAEYISLELIYDLLKDEVADQGIPTSVEYGTLKTGGMFNRETEAIIVVTNVNHPHDYLRHLIRLRMMGNRMAELKVYSHGLSKMYQKRGQMEASNSILNRITGAQRQVEIKAAEEESYYAALTFCVEDVLDKIIIPD